MLSRSSNNKTSQQRSFTKKLSTIENDSSTDNDDDITEFMDQNQRLAITLKNWSIIEDNDTVMMDEGGVATLISLAACDNDSVRKCVSYAFYHLSSRKYNRDDLIELGIVNGIVTIAMRPVSIRTAKLCALTLNNLTMCANQEATVAENGAILALGILMGIKGYRLLPVCVQALYNLTCCDFSSHYKPDTMRRIVKSLISLPQTNFDHITYSVKSIYNICRFSWVRARLVEDGALHLLMTYMEFIPNRTKKEEPTALVITCFRMLCETMSGRNEFIRKKIITNLHNILPFCSVSAALELVFMIFHLFEESIPTQQFESTVLIVTQIIADFEDTTLLQSCSACLYVFAEQQDRLSDSSIKKIFTAVFKLLDSADGLIQDYVVSTCEHIFFNPNM